MSPSLDLNKFNPPMLENSGTQSLDAFNAFLLGKYALSQTTLQSYDEAIRYFEQAVIIDPTFARAHYRIYLACYHKRRLYGVDQLSLKKARLAASNAKKYHYQPPVPWIHIQRRLYRETLPTIRELALEATEKIRHNDPEWGSFGYEQLTWILPAFGFFKSTLEFAKHMLDSPAHNFEDSDANEELPCYYAAVGQFEQAIRLLSSEIQKEPTRPLFHLNRSILYARTGQYEYAERDIKALVEGRYQYLAQAFYYFWLTKPQAVQIRAYHQRLVTIANLHPSYLFYSYCMIDKLDSALEHFAKAVDSQHCSFFDFGYMREEMRAKLPMSIVARVEQHPEFKKLSEKEGIDKNSRKELIWRVNQLSEITGIYLQPEDNFN